MMKMAMEAKKGPDGLVSKEEVGRVARELMEGDDGAKIKKRMTELMEKANNAMRVGGSSYKDMATVAALWKERNAINNGLEEIVCQRKINSRRENTII